VLAAYRRQIDGNVIGAVVASNAAAASLSLSLSSVWSLLFGGALALAAVLCSVSAGVAYSRAKGYAGRWGILGLVPIVGWPVLALLADKCRVAGLPDENFEVALKRARRLELSGDPTLAATWYRAIVEGAQAAAERIHPILVAMSGHPRLVRYAKAQLAEYEQVAQDTGKELEVARRKAGMVADFAESAEAPTLPVTPSKFAAVASWLGAVGFLAFIGDPGLPLVILRLIPAPFAVMTGLLGLRDLHRNPSMYGKGRALFGLSTGVLFTLLLIGLIRSV